MNGGAWRKPARQAVATAWRSGEMLRFAVSGRPPASAAIVVAGVGRSGSTWLADLLAAAPGLQEIFEPLHPEHNAEYRRLLGLRSGDAQQYKRAYLTADGHWPQWDNLLEKALTGRIRSYRTDYHRSRFWPRRFVVKLIRANMMLGYLYERFRPRIVFLTRHPCAVVMSRLQRVRSPWYADAASLLADEALVADFLQPWLHLVEQERDLLGAHAVWWAVENAVARRDLQQRPHHLVFYEALCLHPFEILGTLYRDLGFANFMVSQAFVRHPSRVTAAANYEDMLAWLGLWQQKLSAEDQRRILQWAERLEIPWYSMDRLPVGWQDA